MSGSFPIRCFTCNKTVGNLEKKVTEMKREKPNLTMEDYNKIGVTRYCCVRMFMSHIDLNIYPKKINQ